MSTAGADRDIFGPLLDRAAFRADLLYFIRLAGNYAAQIFIDCRARASQKHRAVFRQWLDADKEIVSDRQLRRALFDKSPWFDAYKADFSAMLKAMPVEMRDRLARTLQQDHLLPWNLRSFVGALDDLRAYRHWLEHSDEHRSRRETRPAVGDDRLLYILGMLLLPHLGNHLLGKLRSHGRAVQLRGAEARTTAAKARLDCALASRREASRFLNGLKRREDHDMIRARIARKYGNPPGDAAVHRVAKQNAKERRDLESRKAAMLRLHNRYFNTDTWPRYNYENFLIRFAFIGRRRIEQLEELAGGSGGLDFIHGVEPLFNLSMDIALILHSWLALLEEAGVPVRNRRKLRDMGANDAIVDIRNALAHGGWFWDVNSNGSALPFRDMLSILLTLPRQAGLAQPAKWRNDLLTRLEPLLRACRKAYAYREGDAGGDPNRKPPPLVVKRWTVAFRVRTADRSSWRIEKRRALRRVVAGWMRDLLAARAEH
jgi:hypothetical protein